MDLHIGDAVAKAGDATGTLNPAVWVALGIKGLAGDGYPNRMRINPAELVYAVGLGGPLMRRTDY